MNQSAYSIYDPVLETATPAISLDPDTLPWRNGLLIRATNWLGDALMTLPATWRMSRVVPDPCGTFVLCPKSLAPLWRAAPWVSRVIPMAGRRCSIGERLAVRRLRPGVAVVLPNSFGSAWDLVGAGIPVRIGRCGRGRRHLLTHRLAEWRRSPGPAARHQLSHYLELAAVFGPVESSTECPPLRLNDAEAKAAEFGLDGGAWLGVAPGAAYGPAKQWPTERFADVVAWWAGRGGRTVVVGTAGERDAGEAIRVRAGDTLNLAGSTDLDQLMAVLSCCDLVLANDSGAMHLAAGLGKDGVAVFGSTDPVATGPIGGRWILLHDPPDCAPCFERTCPRDDRPYECLHRIGAETAIGALEELLENH